MSEQDKVIVVDICSQFVSAGFAGAKSPQLVCKNIVGTSKTKVRFVLLLHD